MQAPLPAPTWALDSASVALAGVGLAQGPARAALTLWAERLGLCTRELPMSAALEPSPLARQREALVIFSQGLSPHARLMMSRQAEFHRALLITAHREPGCPHLARWRAQGGQVLTLPHAEREDGLLVRVQGPAWMTLAALRLTAQLGASSALDALDAPTLARAYARAMREGLAVGQAHGQALLSQPLVMLTMGCLHGLSFGLEWKWIEATHGPTPLRVDALGFVHGGLQSVYAHQAQLLWLRRATPEHEALATRLDAVLRPQHQRHDLVAHLPGPWAALEHDAAINGALCAALEQRGAPLAPWPGQGQDAPLYEIDGCGGIIAHG